MKHFTHAKLQIKGLKGADTGEASFDGYASVFGIKDLGKDIVQPGAFAKTLNDNDGKTHLLADHKYTLDGRLGVAYLTEDGKGLKVDGRILTTTQAGAEAVAHIGHSLEHSVPMGMSFGYDIVKDRWDKEKGARMLLELKLYEVTVTQFPMNESAGVFGMKAADFTDEFERSMAAENIWAMRYAIDSAFFNSTDSALYDEGTSEAERMGMLSRILDQFKEHYLEWAQNFLDFYGQKALPVYPVYDDIRALLKTAVTFPEPPDGTPKVIATDPAAPPEPESAYAALLQGLHKTITGQPEA